jgi:hypothetical protein
MLDLIFNYPGNCEEEADGNVVPLLLGVMRSLITEARRIRGIGRCN